MFILLLFLLLLYDLVFIIVSSFWVWGVVGSSFPCCQMLDFGILLGGALLGNAARYFFSITDHQ